MVCYQYRSYKCNIKRGQTTGSASSLFMRVSENPHKDLSGSVKSKSLAIILVVLRSTAFIQESDIGKMLINNLCQSVSQKNFQAL